MVLTANLHIYIKDAEWILDDDNVIVLGRWFEWLRTVKIIRLYEVAIATEFKESELSLECSIHMMLFNKDMHLNIRFSLSFKDMMKGFGDMLKGFAETLLTLFGDTAKCVDRLKRQFQKDFANLAALGVGSTGYFHFWSWG